MIQLKQALEKSAFKNRLTPKAKISEIFQSIQGEGKYVGVRQIFIRFYECNMHCVWCDTPNSIGDVPGHFEEYTLEGLCEKVLEFGKDYHSVSLTGGEPLVQKDFLKSFLTLLKKAGLKIYLETNGTLVEELKEIIEWVDIVAMDIKLPSSTQCRPYWKEHEEFLKTALSRNTFIKTVISNETLLNDVLQAAELVSKIDRRIVFILQPNYFDMKNGAVKKCLEFEEKCRPYLDDVRVIPQMHKFMKLR